MAEYKKGKKILPSVCIAQGCCESGYFTSQKMINANAVFGIKVGKSKFHFGKAWKDKAYSTKTKECYDGKTYTAITDMFRAYDTIQESVEDYYDLLCNASRYKKAVGETDPKKAIASIKAGGYATDPEYVSTIMSIINSNNLTQYDIVENVEKEKPIVSTAVIVGSARIDENGKISGGAAGDQTGKEVCTHAYYMHSKGWYLYRAKDAAVAESLASAMLDACNNSNIGYDQGDRSTVISQLEKYGTLKKIATKTEADCSSLVRACCIEAGFDTGNFNTASEGVALDKTGMFESRKSVTSSTELFNGDILVTKTKGHTVIVVSGNPRKSSSVSQAQTGTVASASSKFKVGRNYTLQANMYVRESANGKKKRFTKLTVNAKSNGYADTEGYGILKKGTVVTCKDIQEKDGGVWIKIPSGWVCGIGTDGKVYAK